MARPMARAQTSEGLKGTALKDRPLTASVSSSMSMNTGAGSRSVSGPSSWGSLLEKLGGNARRG
jgi:hypothetical protein